MTAPAPPPRHIFPITPLAQFSNKNSQLRRPQEIAYFSYDDHRRLRHDHSSLRSYYPPTIGANLSHGFESFRKHDDSVDEHLDGLLECMVQLERVTGKKCTADVVTWRGMMTKFMTLPFDSRDGFEMNAIKFQDSIYIEEDHTYKQSSRGPGYNRQELMSYWGYKFESLATIPGNWDDCPREAIESREEDVVSNEAQFCSIVKTGFGSVRLIIAGEVDAVWNQNPPPEPGARPPVYIELKTSKVPRRLNDHVNFERKLLRFWSQSFLLGVAKIVVGYRDDDGILKSLEELETQSIPGIAKRSGRQLWDGKLSIDFTASILEWIKETIGGAPEGTFWRIKHAPNSDTVELFIVPHESFLSPTFLQWRSSM